MKTLSNPALITSWICCTIAAIILVQTLFFKFTGASESIYIFTKIGAEPVGRIGSGVIELVASILYFIPGWTWLGALLSLGTMSGAILSHLTILGIVVQNDGGELFALAIITWICSAIILFIHRHSIPFVGNYL